MKTKITSGEDWKSEEDFFDASRRDQKIEIIEKRWSAGSNPIMLVKWGYVEREAWEKCGWLSYPSKARCFECPNSGLCPNYVA
jgi:hypothetical protein